MNVRYIDHKVVLSAPLWAKIVSVLITLIVYLNGFYALFIEGRYGFSIFLIVIVSFSLINANFSIKNIVIENGIIHFKPFLLPFFNYKIAVNDVEKLVFSVSFNFRRVKFSIMTKSGKMYECLNMYYKDPNVPEHFAEIKKIFKCDNIEYDGVIPFEENDND